MSRDIEDVIRGNYEKLRGQQVPAAEIMRQMRMHAAAERLMCEANPGFRPLMKMGGELVDVSKPRSWLVWLFQKQRRVAA